MKIGIIGNGFVGKATQIFATLPEIEELPYSVTNPTPNPNPNPNPTPTPTDINVSDKDAFYPFYRGPTHANIVKIDVMIYDIRPDACVPIGVTLEDLDRECDLLFFCLPTPLYHDGSCYTKILEESISKCKNPFKIIRSTVPVGFSAKHGCYFMPEFLTEANWENDFRVTKKWVVGVPESMSASVPEYNNDNHNTFRDNIRELITISQQNGSIEHNEIEFCSTNEAEMLKLMKNCFLSSKVSLMNEFYDFCHATNTDYGKVVEMAKCDIRMGTSHFSVPGPDGRRGFGGTCFPKDTHSIYCQMEKHGVNSIVFPAVLTRNDTLDRKEREWAKDVWRTTVPLPVGCKVIVVFDDGGVMSAFLTNKCIEELANRHYIILITNVGSKSCISNKVLREHPNFILKTHADMTKPIFIPHVDEIYYSGYHYSSSIHQLSAVLRVLELWQQQPTSHLIVLKTSHTDFDTDTDTGSYTNITSPVINYTKIFEEYYNNNSFKPDSGAGSLHNKRKLSVLF